MIPTIRSAKPESEFLTAEQCYILELWNSNDDPAASIARARVLPGITTGWHRLRNTAERYLILSGEGRVEVGDMSSQPVGGGAVIHIPPGCRQRITNMGTVDLLFLAICTPRFVPENYEDLEGSAR